MKKRKIVKLVALLSSVLLLNLSGIALLFPQTDAKNLISNNTTCYSTSAVPISDNVDSYDKN